MYMLCRQHHPDPDQGRPWEMGFTVHCGAIHEVEYRTAKATIELRTFEDATGYRRRMPRAGGNGLVAQHGGYRVFSSALAAAEGAFREAKEAASRARERLAELEQDRDRAAVWIIDHGGQLP